LEVTRAVIKKGGRGGEKKPEKIIGKDLRRERRFIRRSANRGREAPDLGGEKKRTSDWGGEGTL